MRLCSNRGDYVDWDKVLGEDCDLSESENCKRYYLKSSSCSLNEIEDILGNCIDPSYQVPAVIDRLGSVCYPGNLDLCGVCFGKSDGKDVNGNDLLFDILGNTIECNPSECPAGIESIYIYLDELIVPSPQKMHGTVKLRIQNLASVSNFDFDVTSIKATDARVIMKSNGDTSVLENFYISTSLETISNDIEISKIVGYADSLDSVIPSITEVEDTEFYVEIDFEDIVYSPTVTLMTETPYFSFFGIEYDVVIGPSSLMVSEIWGCVDSSAENYCNTRLFGRGSSIMCTNIRYV